MAGWNDDDNKINAYRQRMGVMIIWGVFLIIVLIAIWLGLSPGVQ